LVFVDVGKDSIMVDDVAMPLNLPIPPLEKEELKKTLFGMNVSNGRVKKNVYKCGVHLSRLFNMGSLIVF
jgi:hypothetical protein